MTRKAFIAVTALFIAVQANARTLVPLYSEADLKTACAGALEQAKLDVAKLETVPLTKVTVSNTLNAWNRMQIRMEDVNGAADVHANMNSDEKIRAAGDECNLKVSAFNTQLNQNKKLYARINAVKVVTPSQKKFKKDLLENFEDAGVALSEDKRVRVKEILDRLEALRQEFEKNVREDRTKVAFTPDEMKGLPQSYLDKAKRDEKGNYLLSFDYPEYEPFITLASDGQARKRYYVAFVNRGGEENLKLMNDIMQLRLEMAKLFGLRSYAEYALRRRMAENPANVIAFLNNVKKTIHEVESKEVAVLWEEKAGFVGKTSEEVTLNRWDVRYFEEKVRKERFHIDQEELRKYFPMPAAINYIMYVSSRLYGIGFKRIDVPVWSKDVVYYDVIDEKTNKPISGFYLDLYPRDGKYKHAAAFGVYSASRIAHRSPVSVLVANVNKDGLNHNELETLLHEFGHVLNNVLSVVDYSAHQWPEWDFVEAPSQMFEEWARRPEALGLFKKVCATCPVLETDLIKRLDEARRFDSGLRYGRQHLYAAYDMAMTSEHPGDALGVWKRMEMEEPLGYVEGTMFPANFTHIINSGYGAGYYGYMWSEVVALDMLSAYGNNLMNPTVGRRFRDTVLSQGGQAPAKDLVRRFLGREPNSKAFFAEITGTR
ncbi:MAG: M3 family metallopeptidase [Pseudomonadota bacterium]